MATNGEHVRKCQKRKKQFAVNAFGGKCQICGYDKCLGALGFHHLNGKEKEWSPSYIIARWSWERAKKELEKCILVCMNCHSEIHYDEELDFSLTRYIKPWLIKVCPSCKNSFDTKEETQTYCSHSCNKIGQRVAERPHKETLWELVQDKSFVSIGKMFGVTDNAIRKWCKYYQLPYRKKDIQEKMIHDKEVSNV